MLRRHVPDASGSSFDGADQRFFIDHRSHEASPTSMTASSSSLLQSYRLLLKNGLRAVRFSSPAKYQLKNILRENFRDSPAAAYNERRISNTIGFLERATRNPRGLEHQILKRLLHLRWHRENPDRKPRGNMRENNAVGLDLRQNSASQYDATLTMFNESEDLCLRI